MNSLITSVHSAEKITRSSVESLIQQALDEQAKSLFILCCDDDNNDLDFFNQLLPSINVPVFGGVFPALLIDDQIIERGVVVGGLLNPVEISVYTDLGNVSQNIFELNIGIKDCQSLLVFVDGLARNIDYMIQQLFHQVGNQQTVIGGGAGSLSFIQKPCIICNQGILPDAMVIVATTAHIELAIGHGWEKLAGPFLATQVDDNRIETLNFQPALNIYQQAVTEYTGLDFSKSEFFEIANHFPFGIERLDDDMLVRDPVAVDGTNLLCVGNVPENTMLYILKGESERLIAAAYGAVDKIKQDTLNENNLASRVFTDGILFDCISRKLFLKDEYPKELAAIRQRICDDCHLLGALVLGEIASGKMGSINFHNKTAVTGLIHRSSITPSGNDLGN